MAQVQVLVRARLRLLVRVQVRELSNSNSKINYKLINSYQIKSNQRRAEWFFGFLNIQKKSKASVCYINRGVSVTPELG